MTSAQPALEGSRPRLALFGALATALLTGSVGCHTAGLASSGYPTASRGASAEAEAAAGAPSQTSAYSDAASERPGLGTVFGENRHSPVREVSFERSSDSPSFVASMLYNDEQGVSTLRSRLGRSYRADEPMFQSFAAGRSWGGVVVRVVDASGRMLPAYHVGERVLLVGESGERYSIEIDNRTDQRYEVIASVDGLDVVDGRVASLNKPGYVLTAHGHLRIDGFRRNMSEVAAFRFGSVRDSYAAQTAEFGDRHVGVIGVALYTERGAEPVEMPIERTRRPDLEDDAAKRESADPFPGRFAQPPARAYY